jgi:hypothetical protein
MHHPATTTARRSVDVPWFKTDDQFHSHPKARRANLAALGLWTLAGSYSMAYKLDGFVPDWYVAAHPGGRKHADTLVHVGLWETAVRGCEEGYVFHDWTDYQPTSQEIEAEREATRQRQREFRARRRQSRTEGQADA